MHAKLEAKQQTVVLNLQTTLNQFEEPPPFASDG